MRSLTQVHLVAPAVWVQNKLPADGRARRGLRGVDGARVAQERPARRRRRLSRRLDLRHAARRRSSAAPSSGSVLASIDSTTSSSRARSAAMASGTAGVLRSAAAKRENTHSRNFRPNRDSVCSDDRLPLLARRCPVGQQHWDGWLGVWRLGLVGCGVGLAGVMSRRS